MLRVRFGVGVVEVVAVAGVGAVIVVAVAVSGSWTLGVRETEEAEFMAASPFDLGGERCSLLLAAKEVVEEDEVAAVAAAGPWCEGLFRG